jgi:subfamily B ATP-binding cassette protein MsbA
MNHIRTVLLFGASYLRRYWVRLTFGLLFSVLFALSNGSFVWATKILTERFEVNRAETNAPLAMTNAPLAMTNAARAKVSLFSNQLKALNRSILKALDPWLPRARRALDWRQVLGVLILLPLLVSVRSVADYLSNYCMGWVSERVIRDLRLDIMEKLSQLSLEFFTRSSTGDLLTRINVDSQNLLRALRVGGADLLKESLTVVGVVAVLIWLDWRLTLCTLVLLPASMFPLIVLGKKARRAMRASLAANISQSSQLVELLGGIRVIKAYHLETEEIARFRETSKDLVRAGMKGIQAKELVTPIIEVIAMVGLGLLLLYVFKTGRSGSELAAFLTGVAFVFVPIRKLAAVHILFEQANVAVQRLAEILNEQSKVVEPPNPKPLREFKSAIIFDHVSFAYDSREVLQDFSLTLPRGFRLGVAGESGSGKTTLVNLLFRFYDPVSGVIKIDGLDLREISFRDLRQQMALVSQDVTLFDETVGENIACGKLGANREEIEAAARHAFAHDFIRQLPQGYDTRVGERGVTLSGGQRQRITIARAFIRDAPILVLDEATGSLDSQAEAEVQAALDRLSENRTVICVAHRLSTLASSDRIIVLSEGRIIEQGTFDELLSRGGAFADMARKQGILRRETQVK